MTEAKPLNLQKLGFTFYPGYSFIEVGDTVVLKAELEVPGYSPFATSIVTGLSWEAHAGDVERVVFVSRPHAIVHKLLGESKGSLYITHETIEVPLESFLQSYVRYTTGHSQRPDNRRHSFK